MSCLELPEFALLSEYPGLNQEFIVPPGTSAGSTRSSPPHWRRSSPWAEPRAKFYACFFVVESTEGQKPCAAGDANTLIVSKKRSLSTGQRAHELGPVAQLEH